MKIWYDACTGKHVRYGVAIAKRLRSLGHKVLLTTRKHPDTLPLARFLKEEFITIGKYNPESLLARLKEGIRRQLLFCKIWEENVPDLAISHGSVDLCRVAFGFKIPIISTFDTPHASAVNRLTLPLTDCVIASKAIPKKIIRTYGARGEIVSFDGVDEVAWIKNFKSSIQYDFGKPLIVVRQLEERAVYAKKRINMLALAKKLTKLGKVVFLSRYSRKPIKNMIVPKRFVDSVNLVMQADLFVGVGGTITREAALQGTPAIVVEVFPKQYVDDFLAVKGFPIFRVKADRILKLAERILGQKCDVKGLLKQLENPVDVIEKIIDKYHR